MTKPTALVIDDSSASRFVLRKFLEAHGYGVDTAENLQDAYFYLRRKRPTVVFLDHLMPGLDGFEALHVMRQEASLSGLPIVLCLPRETESLVVDAHAQGAFDVVCKPPMPDELAAVLQRVAQLVDTGQVPSPRLRGPVPVPTASVTAALPAASAGLSADRCESLAHMLFTQIAELRVQIAQLNAARSGRADGVPATLAPDPVHARLDALGQQLNAQSHCIEAMHGLLMRMLDQDQGYGLRGH